MLRDLKILGLMLVAILAMSAVVASAASATDMFTLESSPTTLTGKQEAPNNNKFKIVGQTVQCETATFDATVSGTAVSEITSIAPTYSGCTLAGVPTTIDTNGCKYALFGNTDANGHGEVRIEKCEAGKAIKITIPGLSCDITIKKSTEPNGNQTAAEGVRLTNIGTGATRELTIDLTVKPKITVDNTGANPVCEEIAVATSGKLTGQIAVTAEIEGNTTHVGIEAS